MLLCSTAVRCVLAIVLLTCILTCETKRGGRTTKRRNKKNRPSGASFTSLSGIDLLHDTDINGIARVDDNTWKWKTRSRPMDVMDDALQKILAGLNISLSFTMEVRPSQDKASTLLHVYSTVESIGPKTWFEVMLDTTDNSVRVKLRTPSLELIETSFSLPEPIYRTWVKIHLSMKFGSLTTADTLSFQAGCSSIQTHTVEEGINFQFPKDAKMEIAGNSLHRENSFAGHIRGVRVHLGESSVLPSLCGASMPPPKKRAPRKSSASTSELRKRKSTSRREAAQRNVNSDPGNQIEVMIEELRAEIQSCKNENRKIDGAMQTLKQIQSSLESRIAILETCECIPMCIAKNGVKRRHGEIWELNECTSCECTSGATSCKSRDGCDDRTSACDSEPCGNNGVCEEIGDTYECRCRRGYHGDHCQHIDSCAYGICKNGALCELEVDGGYRCICPGGYSGENCEQLDDDCHSEPCQNSGNCIDSPSGFICECLDGFSGRLCQDSDGCYGGPCQNSGECTSLPNGDYTCRCRSEFYGRNCELRDGCYSLPCLNGGRCRRNSSPDSLNYTCTCPGPFYGPNCEHRDACYINPCLNGGRCKQELSDDVTPRYTCTCTEGYYGERCQNRDECMPNPCLNGGRCAKRAVTSGGPGYTCQCPGFYSGPRCELYDACFSSPCLNGGRCSSELRDEGSSYYTCQCRDGNHGERCELEDRCYPNPCLNGGRCVEDDTSVGYNCRCPATYSGPRCEFRDACFSSPCLNGGRCLGELSSSTYTCQCRDAFRGSRCEVENKCYANPCLNGGLCVEDDSTVGYTCRCPTTYSGLKCELRDVCFSAPCLNGGRCLSELSSSEYTCQCRGGFHGDRCENQDRCYPNPCLNGGRCVEDDTRLGYNCLCPAAYTGVRCEIRDACFSSPCLNGGRCSPGEDDLSKYTCQCRSGFYGSRCEHQDLCTPNPCLNGGRCSKDNSSLGYACDCPVSYSGIRCEIHDACYSAPCLNGGKCTPVPSSNSHSSVRYSCKCPSTHTGYRCEVPNPCAETPCLNGGVCENLPGGGYSCRCNRNYYGENCESTNYCRAEPCQNGGTCINKPSKYNPSFTCECHDMFMGPLCEYEDLCRRNPCLNGGLCTMRDGTFLCRCPDSYSGDRCELVDFCRQNLCLNGGRCENEESGRGFRCICPDTHTGNRCQQPHPCRPNPCLNNGRCRLLGLTGYSCECPPSHYGPNCRDANYCRSNPCKNGGKCISTRGDYVCECPPEFGGKNCTDEDVCASNPCKNGATCTEEDGRYKCICPQSHYGHMCQYPCNVCAFPSDEGYCEASGRPATRWFYNKFTQSCEQFQYSGCGGNGNNFPTRQACKQRCLVGACCMLRHSSYHINGHTTPIPTSYSCQSLQIGQCKRMDAQHGEIQVIAFKPGRDCDAANCGSRSTCSFGSKTYLLNTRMSIGCSHSCNCREKGYMECRCEEKSVRREIRQLTTGERISFQAAVNKLKTKVAEDGQNAWDSLRDEYTESVPIAQSSKYFLLWNRGFLRKMELLLQSVDCRVSLPFFDFTLDAGDFEASIVWQPNYFGGDGDCVPDHPFRTIVNGEAEEWRPCLSRKFRDSITIPNMIDVASALNSPTYEQLSARLLTIVSYVNAFIGGDMTTSSRAYDPLFYSIHAYIDHIFLIWQTQNPGNNDLQNIQGVNDILLPMTPENLWEGACVDYVDITYRIPCNRSDTSEELFATDGYNLQGYNRQGFDRDGYNKYGFNALGQDKYGNFDTRGLYRYDGYDAEGYNREGYDRRGYDRNGFGSDKRHRDGFNEEGYDRAGFNRYGLDFQGYDRRGFNMYGLDIYGNLDRSEFYDDGTGYNGCCFGRDGLTTSGFDRFGFNVEGYDIRFCEYFFNGPHSLFYKQKLWQMLSVQPLSFLSSVSRTCGPLERLTRTQLSLNWVRAPSSPSSRRTNARSPPLSDRRKSPNEEFSERFCFDVDTFLTFCPCLEENYPAICSVNPCANAFCDLHREAHCVVNMCGSKCTAEFYLDGRRVSCDNPCSPNPCQNGGRCEPSKLSSATERFQCICPDEYIGSMCEKPAPDACMLPLRVGTCRTSVRRWYYDFMTASCREFIYSGCGGNSNNFPSKKACDLRCSLGACCYRLPMNSTFLVGFDRNGYDKYGFNALGFNRRGQHQSAHDSMPTGNRIHAPKGFGPDGYDIYGYDDTGYDRQGYNRDGYHRDTGYNRTGFNADGEFDQLMEFGYDGYNNNGKDRAGYTCNGIDRQGFNQLGLYYEFKYNCESLLLAECEALKDPSQLEVPFEVISFSPGKTCEEVHCEDECGCKVNGDTHPFGQTFQHGCQSCTCTLGGLVECNCLRLGKRREIRDLSNTERSLYVEAVRNLYESGKWGDYATQHAEFMPQANGGSFSLPWHRQFLILVEKELQMKSSCELFIPYFDWTIDAGNLSNSQIWQANFFGSNGEEETNCVTDHPFNHGVHWHPCIKRRFNQSISLPNAVNFQLLLHEPDYESFRLQLEMMSALFHLWVGGHMASPFSPYDPIYLSHWAFIDHIWDQWQKKNPMGISRFPAQQRFVPMKPFDVTPDNVLSSEMQMCVVYIPPTLGSQCNITRKAVWPPSVFDEQGLDRHGFNSRGFDVNGFNINGIDRRGLNDLRSSYDSDGYDAQGYHRSGFDRSGWDKYNYNKFDFNRDGFDIERYDASGYDRYGFDRAGKTPFGMFKNSTIAPGFDRGYAASLFDRYGFNEYGYDRDGLDHKGFDVFGFNIHGLDMDNCNYYTNGPHYMRYFYFAHDQLSMMSKDMIKNIKRICRPITPLPDYWISHIWLENLDLARGFEKSWAEDHSVDTNWQPRTSSVTEDLIWVPITPDQQFCFNLDWYSGCPLGTKLMDCPHDLCADSTCASQPRAQCRMKNCGACYPEFFNGHTGEVYQCYGCLTNSGDMHHEGSTWMDDCSMCLCQGGMISCSPKPCPSVTCTHPSSDQNGCCDVCTECEYNGITYSSGQRFRPNSCDVCDCVEGSVTCQNVVRNCPAVACETPVTMPGECCPSCPTDCHGHREGATWAMDKCHNCTCMDNKIICSKNQCPVVKCDHPRTIAGECCPECKGCEYKSKKYRNQQNFMTDSCTQCSCRFGNVMCTTQQCTPLPCKYQETPPGSCCKRCRQGCEYEGTFYDNGVIFHPQNTPCLDCSCQDGEPRCFRRSCPVVACARPIIPRGECCPKCAVCQVQSIQYQDGQMWTSADRCQKCVCQQGEEICRNIIPCRSKCTHGLRQRGQCCPDCSQCMYHGKVFRHLQPFTDPLDVCSSCSCQSGNVICSDIQCPPVQCAVKETPPNECCSRCKSCNYEGAVKEHGSSWRLSADPCTTCSCREGQVDCEAERCPPAACDNPRSSSTSCCPTCDGCSYRGRNYNNREKVEPDDACSVCLCMHGNVICRRKSCAKLDCLSPVRKRGECCPSCATCTYDGEEYEDQEEFVPARSPCLGCKCEGGNVNCERLDLNCKRTLCSNPGRNYDQCCPTCDSCEYERRNYDNGTTFTPTDSSPCLTCICSSGSVSCRRETCPPLTCSSPVQQDGKCCAVCEECEVHGRTYGNGERWRPRACTVCTCQAGRAECEPIPCADAPCSHPAKLGSECCATCDNCLYNEKVYSSGKQFPNPADPCSICYCQRGNVECRRRSCPRTECDSPVTLEGACCPTCPTDCEISGITILNGESAKHPRERCKTCTCREGRVKCTRRRCPATVECSHPSSDGCCRDQCTDCRYHGRVVSNGQTVPHASDRCKRCTCTDGSVVCIKERCGRPACENPKLVPGACCPQCPEPPKSCNKRGNVVAHGKQFRDNCQICLCQDGDLRCRPVQCQNVSCSSPMRSGCCPSCEGCRVDGKDYTDGQIVPKISMNSCDMCKCMSGDVVCRHKRCVRANCPDPRQGDCCPSCNGCTRDGVPHDNGETFPDPDDPCDTCECSEGTITCSRRPCPSLSCTHPIKPEGECCPVCGGDCLFEGDIYKDGNGMFSPNSDVDKCQLCVCNMGSVTCTNKPCPITNCKHPVQNNCGCSICENCLYNGILRNNRETFPNPENEECSDCYCSGGDVKCGNRRCKSASCTHPVKNACNCPLCDQCSYFGTTYNNGDNFPDIREACNQCTCEDGNVRCISRVCASVECTYPALDDCGCPACDGCSYAGVERDIGEKFIDATNKCNECICLAGSVVCNKVECKTPPCSSPVMGPEDCCPKCIGMCHDEGRSYEDGATFTRKSDSCSLCSCTSGNIRCVRQRCNVRCQNPISQSQCCPDCSACLYQEKRYEEGETLIPRENSCKLCTCYRGNIICTNKQCPEPECENPQEIRGECCPSCAEPLIGECVVDGVAKQAGSTWMQENSFGTCRECRCLANGIVSCANVTCKVKCTHPVPSIGECCPTCDACYYEKRTYNNGAEFQPDQCNECVCTDGNVKCLATVCPVVTCPRHKQMKSPKDCCPRCTSCRMNGQKFSDGESWSSPDDVCTECHCMNGVVTCAKVQCLQPCQATIKVPGQCCPVCAGCYYNNKIFNVGEKFQPNLMDPCEVCECQSSPSGAPIMCCKRKQCPSLANCPRSCIQQPRPGTCCPTCSTGPQCSYGYCPSSALGQQIIPPENGCYGCDCQSEGSWLCMRRQCKDLHCPITKRYTPMDSCCAICDECYLEHENMNIPSGKMWRRSPCEICRCDKGTIMCMQQTCQSMQRPCTSGAMHYKQPGQCCSECMNTDSSCTFAGQRVPAHHTWDTDPCTSCTCFGGKVKCTTQKCRIPMCGSDQVPVTVSGECCPQCMSRPATCVAFGDLHYKTFDGRIINFQGTCQYLLTADCTQNDFKVVVHNSNVGGLGNRKSWTDQVTVITEGGNVAMMRDYSVHINGTRIQRFPFSFHDYYRIEIVGNYLLMTTKLGVQVAWSGQQRRLEVTVPGQYKRKTCGICGNFNNYKQDDVRLRNSRLTNSDAEFGNDWKIRMPSDPPCPNVVDSNPCDSATFGVKAFAKQKCQTLKSSIFSACHSAVSPDAYYAACLYDACACGENDNSCVCDVLESYSALCRALGIVIQWRNTLQCSTVCPYNRGYAFSECGSSCSGTCANRNLPPTSLAEQCHRPCVSGCHCPSGTVEHGGMCLQPEHCPMTVTSVMVEQPGYGLVASTNLNRKRHIRPPIRGRMSRLVAPPIINPSGVLSISTP